MRIRDLIEKLQTFDPDMEVVIDGYEGGVTGRFDILQVNIDEDVNKEWWYGESEIKKDGKKTVVYLMRERLNEDRVF